MKSKQIHPERYETGFRAMLDRLERLSPRITHEYPDKPPVALLNEETAEMTEAELKECNARLREMDRLIRDWKISGEVVVDDFHPGITGLKGLSPTMAGNPNGVVYVEIAPTINIHNPGNQDIRIDGFYFRERHHESGIELELTFVCDEGGWHNMDGARFVESMSVGARVLKTTREVFDEFSNTSIEGDSAMQSGPVLTGCLAIVNELAEAYRVPQPKPLSSVRFH